MDRFASESVNFVNLYTASPICCPSRASLFNEKMKAISCMDFSEIYNMYGDKLCFHGTIGTQGTMPLGIPEDVKNANKLTLRILKQIF